MSERFRTRRGVVALAGALSAFAVVPVAADSQIPGTDALKGLPVVPNVLDRAGSRLDVLQRRASAPERSDPGTTRPAAPRHSTPSPSSAPSSWRGTSSGGAGRRPVTSSGAGSHPVARSSSRPSSSHSVAKAASAHAQASNAAPTARGATRPTVVSPGSDVKNDPTLPFTGSRPLDVLALGLIALAVGLAARWTLRRRRPRQDSNLRPAA
jgi:hypothetical protein